ncbi:MAG: DUF1236 domain-containing protein [Methylocystis sp.]|nr:DUF1236 domain-containing protein [Methylocystis sp.]MBI3275807.1 DUF1236 domain-containing protein [Methylocystis sp.]
MRKLLPAVAALAFTIALPSAATAENLASGAAAGAKRGDDAASSASGVAPAAFSATLEADQRSRFRDYVIRKRHTSQPYKLAVAVGVILPKTVEFYDIPPEFGVLGYCYTIFNDRTVLLDPRTRAVVDVVD